MPAYKKQNNTPHSNEAFHTQAFEQYRRYEPRVAEGLAQMFVAGTSTHKVGEVAQTLMGVARSRQCYQSFEPDPHPTI